MKPGWRPYATETEFPEQSALVNLLQESGTQSVGDLEDGGEHALSQRIKESVLPNVCFFARSNDYCEPK